MRTTLIARGEPEEKVVHLHNAVDVGRFTMDQSDGPSRRRVIYCGTVGMAQGVGTLLDAATKLAHEGDPSEFLIVGDGAERAELEQTAQTRGLTNVRFAGRVDRDQVPGMIGSADIAVVCLRDVPLFEDALPTKMLEYMAAGRPVVASAVGDVARLLDRSGGGVSCAPDDSSALAEQIRALASDPDRARRMGASGRDYVRRHYSRDAFVDALERLIAGVAGDDDEHERARVRRVYAAYEGSAARRRAWSPENPGNRRLVGAMYEAVRDSLQDGGLFPRDGRTLLDIGCGHGALLAWLLEQGAGADCLRGVDLLEQRVEIARERVPGVAIDVGDARAVPVQSGTADSVVLSTVLSSIVGPEDRLRVASEARRVLRPGGVIVVYDLRWTNPRNRSVVRIDRAELDRLFGGARIESRSLTLLPPLARRLGPATGSLYGPLASIPALRTHRLTLVRFQ
jgi:SAM-dependent methyltransferase